MFNRFVTPWTVQPTRLLCPWDYLSHCCCLVTRSCLTLYDLMDCSTPGFPVIHHLSELAQTHVQWAGDALNHPILCCLLLLLPSIFPNIRVFSNESAPCIRLPKYLSFSFSISPSNVYSGLISFRIDWFDLLVVQGTLKSLLQSQWRLFQRRSLIKTLLDQTWVSALESFF